MFKGIKVIGFDADDTLWVNETYFREAEAAFGNLLAPYETLNTIDQELFKIEIANLSMYGYGIKSFVLSMIETAVKLSNYGVDAGTVEKILELGKEMLSKPVELLPGVEKVLQELSPKYRLILLTKGDLLDQQRKLEKSNLFKYFHHIEVMTEKEEVDYSRVLNHLDIKPSEFLMVGNSLKSDIVPLINLKSNAIHVPFHTTWIHEQVTEEVKNNSTHTTVSQLEDILNLIP